MANVPLSSSKMARDSGVGLSVVLIILAAAAFMIGAYFEMRSLFQADLPAHPPALSAPDDVTPIEYGGVRAKGRQGPSAV